MTPDRPHRQNDGPSARERLAALEACFAPGEVETTIERCALPGCGPGGRAAVTVLHRPTGREVTVADRATQVENKIAALEALLAELASGATGLSDPGPRR